MQKRLKSIAWGLVAVLLFIQLFQIDKTNPEPDPAADFLNLEQAPAEVALIMKNACYDCHSFETRYPWYTSVQPVAWWVKGHITEGREQLNFSKWGAYSAKRKDHKLEEMVEMVEEGEMPLKSYTWAHPDARLTSEQRSALIAWFKQTRDKLGYSANENGQSQDHEVEEHQEHEHE